MSLEEEVVKKLIKNGLTIVTAESCTGGLVAGTLVNVAGSSACFNEGYITYSNEAKMRILGVKEESVREFGVVSEVVVREMAEGAIEKANADIGVAVSGIAGPDGGSEEKPVGTVFVACSKKAGHQFFTKVQKFHFQGNREEIRQETVKEVLKMIQNAI